MKIYLYLKNKILIFSIPQKILGSYSFDENPEEESKLINIEARDGKWYIYSTTDVSVTSGGGPSTSFPLEPNSYFILKRSGIEYLVYITESFDKTFQSYNYKDDLNLIIGNSNECNINYNCKYIKGQIAGITKKDNNILLNVSQNGVYVNNAMLPPNQNSYLIYSGDQINIYGLKMFFLNGIILINNPNNLVKNNLLSNKLTVLNLKVSDAPREIEYKDVDLYTKEQYFSKSPRIRRTIQTKEIDLSPPPNQETEEELPLLLTIGPMLTMGVISGVMMISTITRIVAGTTSMAESWPQLATSSAMIISILVWPNLTRKFNKKLKAKKKQELHEKYGKYLNEKKEELQKELQLQKDIMLENLIPIEKCIEILNNRRLYFWDKRIEQSDFLEVRIGIGNALLDTKIKYPTQGFSIDESELKKQAEAIVEEYKYIQNVPIGYSFSANKITAIMGYMQKCYGLIHNIILQLITFYSYEDIKIVVFTNNLKEENWEYIKYLNHNLSNDKSIRFFSSNLESAKTVCDYLNLELQNRMELEQEQIFKPHYIIITDDYSQIKRNNFTKTLTETDNNYGFSLIILEKQMSKLPSKCNNFINLGDKQSGILRNSFESQEQIIFYDEIKYGINMMDVARIISNIPIEFEDGTNGIPDSLSFLEMEKIGKVEQLNIMNRWDTNDSTQSLKAEVGVDEEGNLMYLDLHEKYHGPHGLIAGMTGSGKSEFIITYILSMAINYSPDDVAFILIDYKGGGLAFAFENKALGIALPHLAGTITNLDKAEMDRTLVSIDSEIKRRQQIFNNARDTLGESTIDIYKYQRYYKEGKLEEPIPHLFIICDEFAELKSQQPEFMDNLISVARIGRSLGVHLILATQKPSGVVNDQIWSNTKFRVCLKVQDASDSKEMLKRPDAASLKQAGRFYLQVGYDEYFALGQASWCGAKYYPSEKIIKQVDKSINFIDDAGNIIKSIQAANNIKIAAQGEQLSAILNNVIEVANQTEKYANRLWLNDIEPIILIDNLVKKYNIEKSPYNVKSIIGEYDAPEKQEQGILIYNLYKDGNTLIYGNDEIEKEKMLTTILYSILTSYISKEINIYILDYGSEQLRMFNNFPQVGGMAFVGEDEKNKNLFKLIEDEIKTRKKLLIPYGGSIISYNNQNTEKLPQILFIINNYEGLLESYNTIYEEISTISRDCERYGIYIIISCNTPSSVGRRISQNFQNKYALHLSDPSDYYGIFNMKCKIKPRDITGRGLVYNDGIHEYQTASIVEEDKNINEYIEIVCKKINEFDHQKAESIPSLPEKVSLELIEKEISTIKKVPIGISKEKLKTIKFDFTANASTTIASNKLININLFMDSLCDIFLRIPNLIVFFIDTAQTLPTIREKNYNNKKINYYSSNFDELLDNLVLLNNNEKYKQNQLLYIIYGAEKLKVRATSTKIESLCSSIKTSENSNIIICDSTKNLKSIDFDKWYTEIKNNSDGIWIGSGLAEQQTFRISKITKEMSLKYNNNYGFSINENDADLIKLIEFNDNINKDDDEDE